MDGRRDRPAVCALKASLDALEAATDAKGRRIRVHKLPLPKPVTITAEECDGLDLCDSEPTRTPGERLAASYVNFYIANEAVVMPAFGDPMDEKAQAILQELFPDPQGSCDSGPRYPHRRRQYPLCDPANPENLTERTNQAVRPLFCCFYLSRPLSVK